MSIQAFGQLDLTVSKKTAKTAIRKTKKLFAKGGGEAPASDIQTSANPEFSEFLNVAEELSQRWQELSAKPATDEQLKRIWPAWNALPKDMLPEEKCMILTFAKHESRHHQFNFAEHAKRLHKCFKFLPLDKAEYHQALNEANGWSSLIKYVESTLELHHDLVARQWAFADADSHASGRVAIFRTAQEMNLTHPGLLVCKCPTLEQIHHLKARYNTYTDARDKALAAVSELVFKVRGIRTGKDLPLEERALGVPNPPPDVPRYLFVARLDALGICSLDRLQEFMRDDLPGLSREKRQEFYRMSLAPKYGKEPYATLRAWLLENRPVFEHNQFAWQWSDIQAAAVERGVTCPPTSLRQWASHNKIKLNLRRGPATRDDRRIVVSKPLLSPAPVFGGKLKREPE